MVAEGLNKGLAGLKELVEAGKFVPVVDKTFPLSEVPQALRYFGERHHKGKIVITMWGVRSIRPHFELGVTYKECHFVDQFCHNFRLYYPPRQIALPVTICETRIIFFELPIGAKNACK